MKDSSSRETAVRLLNSAHLARKDEKVKLLGQTFEIVCHEDSALLPEVLPSLMEFRFDRDSATRKFIASSAAVVAKQHPTYSSMMVDVLILLAEDEVLQVQRAVTRAAAHVYRAVLLQAVGKNSLRKELIDKAATLKSSLIGYMKSSNDDIRLHTFKFMESHIITQSEVVAKLGSSACKMDIDTDSLKRDATSSFRLLWDTLKSAKSTKDAHALLRTMQQIGRFRSSYVADILSALEQYSTILPNTISDPKDAENVCGTVIGLLGTLSKTCSKSSKLKPVMARLTAMYKDLASMLRSKVVAEEAPAGVEEPKAKKPKLSSAETKPPLGSLLLRFAGTLSPGEINRLNDQLSDLYAMPLPQLADMLISSVKALPDIAPAVHGELPALGFRCDHKVFAPQSRMVTGKVEAAVEEAKEIVFTPAQIRAQAFDESVARMLETEDLYLRGDSSIQGELVSRIAACGIESKETRRLVKEFLSADPSNRFDFAMHLLFQFFVYERWAGGMIKTEVENRSKTPIYDALLLDVIKIFLGNPAAPLGQLVLDAPALPRKAITLVEEGAFKESSVSTSLASLRDLTIQRPAYRGLVLPILMNMAFVTEDFVRVPAVNLIANQIFLIPSIAPVVEEFAAEHLAMILSEEFADSVVVEKVRSPAEAGDEDKAKDEEVDKEAEKKAREEQLLARMRTRVVLYLALCTKKPKLIQGAIDVFCGGDSKVRGTILKEIGQLVNALGSSSAELLWLISHAPKEGIGLSLKVLEILSVASGVAPEGLLAAIRTAYGRRADVRLLIPFFSSLNEKEVIDAIPSLARQPESIVRDGTRHLLFPVPKPLAAEDLLCRFAVLSPSEDRVPVAHIRDAVEICLSYRGIMTEDVVYAVLRKLMKMKELPILFMRLAIQARRMFPALVEPLTTRILPELIERKVWEMRRQFEGFLKFCQLTVPEAIPALLSLPEDVFTTVLKRAPGIKDTIKNYVINKKPRNVPSSHLRILGI